MNTRTRLLTVATSMVISLTAACSSSGDDSSTSPQSDAETAPSEVGEADPSEPADPTMSEEQLVAWVEDVLSNTPPRIRSAQNTSAEGSVAAAYASYRLAVANSNIDGGYPQEPWNVTGGNGTIEACPVPEGDCTTFTSIEQADGSVVSFEFDGTPLEGRFADAPRAVKPVAGLATIQLLAGYRTVSNSTLVVAVRVKAGAQPITVLDANYRSPSGRQTQSDNISGPPDLQARSSATYTLGFPGAKLGGAATLRFYTDGAPIPATVDVLARP